MEFPFCDKYKLEIIKRFTVSESGSTAETLCPAHNVEETLKTLNHAIAYCTGCLTNEQNDTLAKILLARL